jgi:hypothetical protein
MVLAFCKAVAVLEFPVKAPTNVVAFTILVKVALWSAAKVKAVVAVPPLVVVRNVSVRLFPVPAVTVILLAPPVISVTADNEPVTFADPLKFFPQIVRVLANIVAEAAKVAVEAFPLKAAVIVPAAKFPLVSRATIAEFVFTLVAVVAEFETFKAVEIVASFVSDIAALALISAFTMAPAANDGFG